jgi:hypothetical protein
MSKLEFLFKKESLVLVVNEIKEVFVSDIFNIIYIEITYNCEMI